jgi:hypothetical protein
MQRADRTSSFRITLCLWLLLFIAWHGMALAESHLLIPQSTTPVSIYNRTIYL